MDGEVTAALIGGASGLVGALLGGSAAVWTARHQGRLAVTVALETARSAYLGPLDTARRSAQRDVFAAFLTVSQEWARIADKGAYAAQQWDARVRDVLEMCIQDEVAYPGVDANLISHWQGMITSCGTPHKITEAAQHVVLEAATTDVARAAQSVEQQALELERLLRDAGKTGLRDAARASPDDPSNHVPPLPDRSPDQLRALKEAIEAFTRAAAMHLNSRETGNDLATSSSS